MKKKMIAGIMVMMSCLLSAGSVLAETDVSPEEIMRLSELSGMNAASIGQILSDAGISEEQLQQMSEEEILEGLRIKSAQSSVRDYSYLFTDPSVSQTLDGRTLKRVAVYSTDDAISPSLMIDYEEGRIYYSGGIRIFDNIDLAESVQELDQNTAEEVKQIVREILDRQYAGQVPGLLSLGDTLAGIAIETDLGVTSFTVQNMEEEASMEQSSYISRIFRIYYDNTGQGW